MKENLPVKMVKSLKVPKEPGKYYRLLCMTGKNKGFSYFINSKRIVMGRSEKVDVQVLDGKSSREHAELALVGDQYVLTDLGSQNGVIVNDLKVSQHRLTDNDKIIIGQTVYKYNQIEVKKAELPTVVDDEDEFDEYEEDEEEETGKKGSKKGGKKKNNKIMILIIAVGAIFLLPEEEVKDKRKRTRAIGGPTVGVQLEDVNKREAQQLDPDVRDKLSAFIHRGQREYRERNYYRAIEQFELALILVPNHVDASFYLRKTKEAAKQHIKQIEIKAQQETDGLKYKGALTQYCAIIQFYQEAADKQNIKSYANAEKQIEILEEKLGYQKGEFKCY